MKIREAKNAKAVIVIVHGAFEHSGRYDWVVEQLISHDYHVVYGDLPGQGENIPTKRGHIRSFQQYLDTVKTWVTMRSHMNYLYFYSDTVWAVNFHSFCTNDEHPP